VATREYVLPSACWRVWVRLSLVRWATGRDACRGKDKLVQPGAAVEAPLALLVFPLVFCVLGLVRVGILWRRRSRLRQESLESPANRGLLPFSIFLLHATVTLYLDWGRPQIQIGRRELDNILFWGVGAAAGVWLILAATCAWWGRPRLLVPPPLRD
jgi:hypothetical protein